VHVVATAGHVDHGKSTLVRVLTGMEPDRYAEEQRRGMTIDLGFAWTSLPAPGRVGAGQAGAGQAGAGRAGAGQAGAGRADAGPTVAFVDVPGHERFLATMLAGVGPVPAVLFVVAADGGWGRQSAEHLGALDALGVRHGLLAVTRSDLADPAPATRVALEHLARTSLGAVESVAVSGRTGAGLPELRAALVRMVARLPAPRPQDRLRLWVDRAFTIRGSGTVVTGTLGAGTVRVGDELRVEPGGRPVRVRGLQSLKSALEVAGPVARVAVNLRGVDPAAVPRGSALVAPGTWHVTSSVDARLAGVDPGGLPAELVLHVGSAAVAARLRPLGGDAVRLALHSPLPLVAGDRTLLRDPGAQRVVAGAVLLDVDPPALRRRGAARSRALALADAAAAPDPVREVLQRGAVTRAALAALGALPLGAPLPAGVHAAGDVVVAPATWSAWTAALHREVAAHAAAHPLEAGIPAEVLRRRLDLPGPQVLDALLAGSEELTATAGRVHRRDRRPAFPAPVEAALGRLRDRLAGQPFVAPEQPELAADGLTPQVLAAAERAGLLARLPGGLVVAAGYEDEAVRRLAALAQPFALSEARAALGTTRRVAVPLLEHLDARRRTRRLPDSTRTVLG